MSETYVTGIDCSYDELTEQEAQCLKDQDILLFGQCLWTGAEQPATRVVNLRRADNAGRLFWTYTSLTQAADGAFHVNRGRQGIPDDLWDKQLFACIDIELPGIRVADVLLAADRLNHYGIPDERIVIYTSYHGWVDLLVPSNSLLVSRRGLKLLNAYWDLNPDIDFPSLRFGGWRDDQVIGEQYSGDVPTCGQHSDRSIFVAERLPVLAPPPIPPEDEEAMLKEKIIGFDGRPVEFIVLTASPPPLHPVTRELTYGEYLLLQALGLLVGQGHGHTGTVVVR